MVDRIARARNLTAACRSYVLDPADIWLQRAHGNTYRLLRAVAQRPFTVEVIANRSHEVAKAALARPHWRWAAAHPTF